MRPFDTSILGDGFVVLRAGSTEPRRGLVAEIDQHGNLVHFGAYGDGVLERGATITPGEPRGQAVFRVIDRFPELDPAHLPLGITVDEMFRAWLTGVVERVRRGDDSLALFCSFCGKAHKEVKKLVAGPAVCICDQCVALCSQIVAEDIGATK